MWRIHLGWLQLRREKLRTLVALAGVCFAATLILMWLGFRSALYESSARYHETLVYDVILVSPETPYIVSAKAFSSRRLHQIRGIEEVESVAPVYMRLANWKNPWNGEVRRIFTMAFDPAHRVFELPAVRENVHALTLPDVALYDDESRPEFGPVAERFRAGEEIRVEVNHRSIEVVGLFSIGTSFGVDGSLLMSDTNFLRIFPKDRRGLIHLGLIRLVEGADPETLRDRIRSLLPGDVLVLTKRDYVEREVAYWSQTTPIGYVFGFGVIIGFVVGSIIVYQILFADVSDHLAEYATLKAMGYSNAAVSGVVVEEALLLALLGFLPGLGLSALLYSIAADATNLPMHLDLGRALAVLGLTVLMCSISGLLALRKVRAADPAEIF